MPTKIKKTTEELDRYKEIIDLIYASRTLPLRPSREWRDGELTPEWVMAELERVVLVKLPAYQKGKRDRSLLPGVTADRLTDSALARIKPLGPTKRLPRDDDWRAAHRYANDQFEKIYLSGNRKKPGRRPVLTQRDYQEILNYKKKGYSDARIGNILGIKTDTVRKRRYKAEKVLLGGNDQM